MDENFAINKGAELKQSQGHQIKDQLKICPKPAKIF